LYKIIYFPRSIAFIAIILIGILIILHRILISFLINLKKNKIKLKNILIIGINKSNIELIKNIRQNNNYGKIKCIIDSSNKFRKRELNGIKIYKKDYVDIAINKHDISEIIIGSNALEKKEIAKLYNKMIDKNIRVKNFSKESSYTNEFLKDSLTSKIDFFDIINRPKISIDSKVLKKQIQNKIIIVTGAGGSIGSELCIEILKSNPKRIYAIDFAEINLFNIKKRIANEKNYLTSKIKFILGDCNDYDFMRNTFNKIIIDDIYHAAAYKHLTFGEENSYSMFKNNVLGTKKVINFAIYKKVKNFIFISSDKAVNPKSVLGITKKFGERLVKYLYENNKSNYKASFTIVRFGNVIGSSGSVIPIFLKQIEKRLPLTVTNINAKRYFMNISEAVQLVINASYINKSGVKIYALDMGEQISILSIAKKIIQLSGLTFKNSKNPNGDIPIKITGLTKGEKILEELTLGNNLKKTIHSRIMQCEEKIEYKNLNKDLKIMHKNIFKKSTF
tara:strand:- start:2148 stop:3662 length:1515 start_codon:yes stop_codon:yes gene_type:complete